MTNISDLTPGWVTDDLRIHTVATCEDADEHITGIRFTMRGDASSGPPAQLAMGALGPLVNCSQEFEPTAYPGRRIDKIDVQWNQRDGVTGLRYGLGRRSLTFGSIEDSLATTSWVFTEENPLIGVYGDYNNGKINKLGFITVDTQCQQGIEVEEPPTPVDPTVDPPVDPVDPDPVDPDPVEPLEPEGN